MSDSQDAAAALRREERQARRERLQAELQAEEERMKKAREERRRRREERDSARPATLTAADPHPASSASPTAATSISPSSSKPGSRKASLDRETRRKRSADSAAALHRLNASDASAHAAEAAAAAASAPPSTTPAPAPPGGAVSSRTATTAPSNGRRSSVVILDEIELDRKRAVDKRKSDLEERRLKLEQDLKKTEEERERRQREREERIRKRREEAEDEEKATEALLEKQRHRRETEREEERRREEESRLKAEREASEREEKLKAERVRRQAEREARQRKIQEEADREMEALQKRRDEREAARKAKEAERQKAEEEREAERLAKRRAAEEARAKEEEERRVKEEEKQRVFAEEAARRKQELEAMQANAIKTSVERRSSQEVEARKAAEAETQGKEKERTAALVRRMSQEDAKWERRRSQDLVERQRSQFMEEGLNSHKVMEEGKEEAKKNKKKKKEEEEKEEEDPLKKLERERAERRAKRDRELVEQAERAAAERKTRLEKERAESERRQKELEAEREKRAAERKMEIERERMKGEAERKRREEEEVERERARQRAREEREAERRAARERQQSGSGQHKRPSVDANVLPSTLKKQLSMPREEKKKEERKVVSRKASEVKAMFEPKAVTKSTESSVAANTTRGEDGEDGELFAALEKELASASLAEKDEVISQLLDSKNAPSSSSSSSSSSRPPARKGSTTTVSGKAAPSKTTATKTTVIRSPPRMRRSTTASALGTNSSKAMTTTRISSPPSHRRGSSSTSQAAKTHEDASATVARMTRRNTDVDVASPRSSETTRAAAKRMPSSLSPSASAAQSALDKRNQELERIAMLRKKTRDEEHTKVERRTSGGRFEGVVAAASAFTPLAGRVASIKQQVEPKGTTEEKHAKRELERLAKERESARLADDAHEREELRRVQQEQETATRARREREREIERLAQEREKARLREEQEERKQRDQRDQAIRERERELNRIADEREAARLRAAGSTTSPVKRKTSSGGMASVAPGGGAAESGGTLERIAAERERRQKVEAERERERKAHLMQERQRSLGQREIKAALGATPVTAVDDTAVKRGEELETTKKAARDKLQAEEAERASRLEEKSKEREATRLAALQVVESARQAEVEKKQRDEQETKVKVEKTAASVSAAVAAETAKTEELLAERAAKRVAARRLSSEKSAADRAAMRAAVRSLSRERTVEEEEGKGTETKNHDESVPAKATSLARAMLVDTETKGDEESIAPMSPGRLDGRKLSEVAAPPPMLQEVPVVEVTLDETPTPSRLIHATRSRPKSVSSRRQTQGNPVRRTMRLGQSTSELLSSQEEAGGSGSDDNGDDKLPRASRSVSSSSAMDGSLEVMGAPEPNNEDGLGEEPSSSRPTRGRLPTSPPWSPPAGVRSSPRIRPLSESAVGSARSYRTPHGVSKEDVGGGRDGKRRVMLRDSSLPVKEFEPRMYLCKGKRKVYVQVVPAAMSSLCATDVFVYDARESVFVWYGKKASRVMRAKGLDLSTRIKDRERGGKVPVISFDQDQTGGKPRDKLRFYSELSGSVDEIRGADNSMDDSAYEKALAPRVRLYTLSETSMTTDDASDAVGDWQHVASGKELKTTLLDSSRVYVLDAWCAIFAWLGARAEGSCRTKAKNYATALVSQKESPGEAEVAAAERASRPDTAYYEIVRDKSEPSIFKEQFVDWAEGMTLHVRPVSNIERKEKTPYVTGADVVHVGTAEMARQISEEEGDALPDERWMQEVRGDDGKGKVTVYAVDVGGKAVEVDRKEHGIFYSAEAYVILYELSVRADAHILYVWRGDDTPKKRVGNVVPVAMDLGKRFSASHVNIEQGREPVHFASMFGGRIVVSRGARVDAGKASLQLYQVRGDAERVHAVECDTAHADRLVSDSSFVVLAGGDAFAFVWHGSRSTPAQREAALSSATLLTGIASPESAKQGAEPPALVSLLKMDTSVARNAGGGPMGRARAWQVSSVEGAGMDGKVTTQRIHFLKQADFDDESCLLVDGGAIVYAWAGPSARQSDVKVLLLLAHEYGQRVTGAREKDGVLDGYEHAADAVVAVSAGEEPVGLQSLVCGWSRRSSRDQHKRRTAQHARHSIVSTGNVAALLELTQQETVLSLDALRTTPRDQLPPTVDKARLEQHLSASDFLQTFAIDRSAFNKLPLWKQVVLRKKAGLF